jgi:hypothetical protein
MVLLCEPSTSSDFGLAKSADFWRNRILFRHAEESAMLRHWKFWGATAHCDAFEPLIKVMSKAVTSRFSVFIAILQKDWFKQNAPKKDHVCPNCVSKLQNVRWTSGVRTWKHVREHTWTWLVMHAQLWFVRVIIASHGREFRDKTFKFIFWKLFFNNRAAFFWNR